MLTLDFTAKTDEAPPRRKLKKTQPPTAPTGTPAEAPTEKAEPTEKAPKNETLNYVFGVIGEPTNRATIEEIFYRRHALRNALVLLELERRKRIAEILAKYDPELAKLTADTTLARTAYEEAVALVRETKKKEKKYKLDDAQVAPMRAARIAYIAADKKMREKQKSAYKLEETKADQDRLKDWVAAQTRTILNRCGLHYHNYNDVVDACKRFTQGPPPRLQPFIRSDTHKVVVATGGLTVTAMFAAMNTAIKFTPIDNFAPRAQPFLPEVLRQFQPPEVQARFRGGEKKTIARNPESKRQKRIQRAKAVMLLTTESKHNNYNKATDRKMSPMITTTFQVLFNKRKHFGTILPEGTNISHVHLIRSHRGSYAVWSVMLTISAPTIPRAFVPASDGTVGVDLGWRMRPDGLRVAYARGSDGWESELVIPTNELKRWSYPPNLIGILDTHLNACCAALKTALATFDEQQHTLPKSLEWLRQAVSRDRINPLRLYDTFVAWSTVRFSGDQPLFQCVGVWAERWSHLKSWERNMCIKAQRWRKDLYLRWAMVLRTKYQSLGLEDVDWRLFAREELNGVSSQERENVEFARRTAAVSTLKLALLSRFKDTSWGVNPANTTKQCHVCAQIDTWDAAKQLLHTCTKCGTMWDQDKNAAANLCKAVEAGDCFPIPESRKVKKERKAKKDEKK